MHSLVLIALGAVIGGNLYLDHGAVTRREEASLLLQASIVHTVLVQHLQTVNAVLLDLRTHAFDIRKPEDIGHRLDILVAALNGVSAIVVLDATGTVRAASQAGPRPNPFKPQDAAGGDTPQTDPLFISPPCQSAQGGVTIAAGRAVPGPDGSFAGLVYAVLDLAYFEPLLGSILVTPDMWANLVHADGTIFLAMPDRTSVVGKNLAQPGTLFTRHRDSGRATNVFTGVTSSTGERRMLAVCTILPSELSMDAPLYIAISRDLDAVYAGWRSEAALLLGLFAAVALVSTLFLLSFQKRQRQQQRQIAEAAQTLKRRERFIRTITDNIPGMVGYWNTELRCEYANKAYLDWFGMDQEQMRGITIQELMGGVLFAKNEPYIRAALAGEPQTFERILTKADGSTGYTLARYIPDWVGGQVRGFFVLVSDVTELKTTQLELEQRVRELDDLAATDPLTGIANRRAFLERSKEEFARAKRYGLPLAFLMIDVDHFKAVNDVHGHDVGDDVLKLLAATLKTVMRATDHYGRLGGEEFGALLVQTDLDEAKGAAQRLRQALGQVCVHTPSGALCIKVSIGIAGCNLTMESLEALIKCADMALYQAKATGRDKVCCYGEF